MMDNCLRAKSTVILRDHMLYLINSENCELLTLYFWWQSVYYVLCAANQHARDKGIRQSYKLP